MANYFFAMLNWRRTEVRYLLLGVVIGIGFSLLSLKVHTNQDIWSFKPFIFQTNNGISTKRNSLVNSKKILCWILTNPKNHKTRSLSIKNTWGKRCDTLLFMSSAYDAELPTIAFPLHEGKKYNWGKIKAGFKYVYENHFDDADWFFKVDDDAYVVFENLQHMLQDKDPNDPVWFGSLFTSFVKTGWHSGGPGYVLSKEAVRRFVVEGIANKSRLGKWYLAPRIIYEYYDFTLRTGLLGTCLGTLGVHAGDSRDELGRHRFIPLRLQEHLIPGGIPNKHWFWRWNPYPKRKAMDMVSDVAVSFHYTKPEHMYVLEYMIYHLKVFGSS